MSSIDKRIVEMRFDNAQFEAGVKDTVDSLGQLEKGLELKGASKGLEEVQKASNRFSLAGIAESVNGIADKFSVLGVVGFTVFQDLTRSAMNFSKKLVGFVLDPLFAGGKKRSLNIEQAKFQFEGLGMDIEATMASALEAVKGTAYGLDEAAKVASQFGASGLRAGDDMTKALRGISGVAAMTSSSYEDIGRIFTTVAGNGRLMGNQLLQLSGRGLNVAAALAESMGISEKAVREMVTEGKIDFETFAFAMDDAFGEHATSANKTFTGSLSNVRAALSRIGAGPAALAFEGLRKVFNALIPAIDGVGDALAPSVKLFGKLVDIVSKKAVKALGDFDMSEVMKGFKIEPKALDSIKDAFKGLFAMFDIGKQAVSAFAPLLSQFIGYFAPLGSAVLNAAGIMGQFLVSMSDNIRESEIFIEVAGRISKFMDKAADAVKKAMDIIVKAIKRLGGGETEAPKIFVKNFADGFKPFEQLGGIVGKALGLVKKAIDSIVLLFTTIAPTVSKIGSAVFEGFMNIIKGIYDGFKNADFNDLFQILNAGLLGTLVVIIKDFVRRLMGMTTVFSINLGILRKNLELFTMSIKSDILMKIAKALAILTISIVALSLVDSAKLAGALGGMAVLIGELTIAMAAMQAISAGGSFGSTFKLIGLMTGLAGALLLLSGALVILSRIDSAEIAKGLIAMGVMMGELLLFLKVVDLDAVSLGKSIGLIALAGALNLMARAVRKFGEIDANSLVKGLGAMGIVMAEIALFSKMTKNTKNLIATAAGMVILGGALHIMAGAVQKFGEMEMETMGKGLMSIAGALIVIATTMQIMPPGLITAGAGMVIMAGAILLMSSALKSMGSMEWEEIGKGMAALYGIMGSIVIMMNLMTGSIAGAAAMLIVAAAINALIIPLKIFGSMELSEIGKGLLVLAGAFTIIGVAAAILGPLVPAILGLGAGIALIGGGVALAGAGLLLMSTGLAAIAVSGVAASGAIIVLGTAIFGLIPALFTAIGEGIIAIAKTLGDGAKHIAEAFGKIIMALIPIVEETGPRVVEAIAVLIVSLVQTIADHAPQFVEAGYEIILSLLRGLRDNIEPITVIAGEIMVNFLNGLAEVLPDVIDAGFNLIIEFIDGMATAIDTNHERLIASMENLLFSMIDASIAVLISSITTFKESGTKIMEGLKESWTTMYPKITESISTFLTDAKQAILGFKDKFFEAGSNIIAGLANGIKEGASKVVTAAREAASNAWDATTSFLKIKSPSKKYEYAGMMMGAGMENGIKKSSKNTEKAAKEAAKKAAEASKKSFEASMAWMDEEKYYGRLSLAEELAAFERLQKKYKKGSEQRIKIEREIFRLKKDIEKASYDHSIKWIDDRKYYNELSLKEELAAWERVHARYKEGSAEKEKADRELYRLKLALIKAEYDNSMAWIDDKKYYNKLSLEEELAAWERVHARYKDGDEERKRTARELYRVRNEIAKKEYDDQLEMIDDRKYYEQLSLSEELKFWQGVQKKYAEGAEERKKADREVYRLRKELTQKAFNDEVARIDDLKYYNKLSMKEELMAWESMQKRYKQGTEQRKKADREVYRLEQDLNNKRKEINDNYYSAREQLENEYYNNKKQLDDDYYSNAQSINDKLKDDIKSLNDSYEDALKSRTDALYKAYGLFDRVDNSDRNIKGSQLMGNLEGQIKQMTDWRAGLDDLTAKGINKAMISELEDMGPQSLYHIQALNNMSDEELTKYVTLWDTKHKMATTQATNELAQLRIDTQLQIQELEKESAIELDALKTTWQQKSNELRSNNRRQLSQLRSEWQNNLIELDRVNVEHLDEIKGEWAEGTEEIRTDAKEEFEGLIEDVESLDWDGLGVNIVSSVISGVNSKAADLREAVRRMAEAALAAANAELGIRSPSTKFIQVGKYVVEGFVNGLSMFTNKITSAGSDLGRLALEASRRIVDGMDDEMSFSPIITPVLDMSNIEKSKLWRNGYLNLDTSNRKSRTISDMDGRNNINVTAKNDPDNKGFVFYQNNYSPKSLSRIDIYRQTKNQLSVVKGVLNKA